MGRKLATVLFTIGAFILIVLLAGVAFMYSGVYNVAANDSHEAFIQWLLLTTTKQSIANHANKVAPVELPSDSTALRRGFKAFENMCVQCHGAPGIDRGWIGKGVMPAPPHLHEEASDLSDAELYWVIRNGVKFTSMPSLEATHTDDQIKELAAFAKQLPTMDETEYAAWLEDASADGDTPSDSNGEGNDHGHDHGHDHAH